jgi:hypothetical protein
MDRIRVHILAGIRVTEFPTIQALSLRTSTLQEHTARMYCLHACAWSTPMQVIAYGELLLSAAQTRHLLHTVTLAYLPLLGSTFSD